MFMPERLDNSNSRCQDFLAARAVENSTNFAADTAAATGSRDCPAYASDRPVEFASVRESAASIRLVNPIAAKSPLFLSSRCHSDCVPAAL
jgi:hypothetical protein